MFCSTQMQTRSGACYLIGRDETYYQMNTLTVRKAVGPMR
jgi:hypothetical protein